MDKTHPDYARHKEYSSKRDFAVRESIDSLSQDEEDLVHRYGHWMNALASGELDPITEDQKRFVSVCQGNEEPITKFEIAWMKYLRQKEEKRKHRELQYQADLEFRQRIKGLSDEDLKALFTHKLSVVEKAYLDNEWRRRFPYHDVGVVYATTDGQ